MLVQIENPNDLSELIKSHRGTNDSEEEASSPHMRSSFIGSDIKNANKVYGISGDDLDVFEVVNSFSPTK